ncbi:MAG TPA: tetratricopeptide repeat protein [Hyphomicrobiaceae bacterium]|nr:tetratricopeptide repeat protein [Hyphomicrobiaceae bacterium]
MKFSHLMFGAAAIAFSAIILSAAAVTSSTTARAMGGEPAKPKIDCRKRKNKKKPECRKRSDASTLSDEERYQAGHWLARSGNYAEALVQLRQIANQDDPRVLNYIGFATRKLGRFDEAKRYYNRVLAIDPNYTLARAYLGEAHLQQGDVDKAKGQLAEIGQRCGKACAEYVALADQIKSYMISGTFQSQGGVRG